jgi:hypothetical protein
MSSNVGNSQVYEAGDQRNPKTSEVQDRVRYEEGVQHSHIPNDSSTSLCIQRGRMVDMVMLTQRNRGPAIDRKPSRQRGGMNQVPHRQQRNSVIDDSAQRKLKRDDKDDPETAASKKDPTLPVGRMFFPLHWAHADSLPTGQAT